MSSLKILIAAGGTGGHIYPALAIADAFVKKNSAIGVEFVGTPTGLENKIIPAKGYALHHLPIGRLNSNVAWTERLKTLLMMPLALVRSFFLLRAVKPDFVLGVGGHASGPLLLIAALFGYRSAIWEPNAMPGMANRWLAKFVDDCWVVFEEAKPLLKNKHLHRAGMPVRDEIEVQLVGSALGSSEGSSAGAGVFRVLVFGGSLGARGINNTVVEMVKQNREWLSGVHIVHQTGSGDFARVSQAYREMGQPLPVDVREYLNDMGQQYANADLVICRSGAGTLAELAACGKASILIPLPTAADDHQRKNAESLAQTGGASVILQKDLNAMSLREAIQSFRTHPERLKNMQRAVRLFHQPRAADVLVGEFMQRIESHASR